MQALVTARLRLEPLVEAHADALYPVLTDPRQSTFLDQAPPASLQALRERHRWLESRRSADGREHWLNWALVPLEGPGHAVGLVQATVGDDGRTWIAYQVAHALWGRGLATEATGAMLAHLADAWPETRFLATVDRRNERSWRLLERLAFTRANAAQAAAMGTAAGDWLYLR